MTISAEMQEAAIHHAARAYWLGCMAEPPEWLSEKNLEMIKALGEYRPSGSNAVRAAAVAVLEFLGLRSPDACFECSASAHWCYVCRGRTDHWHEVTAKIRCETCLAESRQEEAQ